VSLTQLARAYTMFARDGDLVPLSLTRLDAPPASQPVISGETARAVRAMLELAVQPGGTAPRAQTFSTLMCWAAADRMAEAFAAEAARTAKECARTERAILDLATEYRNAIARLVERIDAEAPAPACALPEASPEDICYLQYSSGSTRFPTGVAVTHTALLHNLYNLREHAAALVREVHACYRAKPLAAVHLLISARRAPQRPVQQNFNSRLPEISTFIHDLLVAGDLAGRVPAPDNDALNGDPLLWPVYRGHSWKTIQHCENDALELLKHLIGIHP
jgi:hypothetical protein